MKLIEATLGRAAMVDDADFERLSCHRWYAHNSGTARFPEKRPARRTSVAEGRKVVFLVHEIMRAPKGMVVDHIDGDPWNNQRSNLRICTNAENIRNQRRKHRPGQFKGVYRRSGQFLARVSCDGVIYDLGAWSSAEEAARAYDAAALYLHGEFAAPNFADDETVPTAPADVRAQSRERSAAGMAAAEIATLVKQGATVRAAAEQHGIKYETALRWIKRDGLKVHRGRPRKSPAPAPEQRAAAA